MVDEFESDLIRLRTVEAMKVAKAKGRLRGKQPKLNLFGVGRSTVHRAIERQRVAAKAGLAEASSRR